MAPVRMGRRGGSLTPPQRSPENGTAGKAKEAKMKLNMGLVDRGVRAMVGLVIIMLGLVFKSWWGAIGLLPLLSAVIGWCPGYLPFGISTRRAKADATPS